MLVDQISNWQKYGFGPAWEKVMEWLAQQAADHAHLENGKHEVGGCTINVDSLTSRVRSQCRYEYHKRFCDVQMVLEGEEWFFNTAATGLVPSGEFDETRDIGFFAPEPPEATRVTLRPGMFVLVFPWDAHMPAIATGTPAHLRKCVAKIPLEALLLA